MLLASGSEIYSSSASRTTSPRAAGARVDTWKRLGLPLKQSAIAAVAGSSAYPDESLPPRASRLGRATTRDQIGTVVARLSEILAPAGR